jgi:hypothetical protein
MTVANAPRMPQQTVLVFPQRRLRHGLLQIDRLHLQHSLLQIDHLHLQPNRRLGIRPKHRPRVRLALFASRPKLVMSWVLTMAFHMFMSVMHCMAHHAFLVERAAQTKLSSVADAPRTRQLPVPRPHRQLPLRHHHHYLQSLQLAHLVQIARDIRRCTGLACLTESNSVCQKILSRTVLLIRVDLALQASRRKRQQSHRLRVQLAKFAWAQRLATRSSTAFWYVCLWGME